jgi:hypothetical protein
MNAVAEAQQQARGVSDWLVALTISDAEYARCDRGATGGRGGSNGGESGSAFGI